MSASAGPPQKTALGVDELRRRTRGLSQRHRTMLLLVNGQRSKREVLALAAQAGVGVEFFDELVAMALVDPRGKAGASGSMPASEADVITTAADTLAPPSWGEASSTARARLEPVLAPSAPGAPPAQPAEAAAPAVTETKRIEPGFDDRIERAIAQALAKPEPAVGPPPGVMPPATPTPAPEAEPHLDAPRPLPPMAEPSAAPRGLPPVPTLDDAVPESQARPASADAAPRARDQHAAARAGRPSAPAKAQAARAEPEPGGAARVKFSGAAHKPPKPASRRHAAAARRDEPKLTPVEPPARPPRMKMPAAAGPLEDEAEERLLAEVRSLLIGTLLVDGPVTSSLTALRVRKANTRFDLTALVWEIERTLVRAKRPREAQARLRKARDMLGLGNTVVDEETSPEFPRTLPPPRPPKAS